MKLCEIVYVVNYVKLQESNHIVATYSAYLVSPEWYSPTVCTYVHTCTVQQGEGRPISALQTHSKKTALLGTDVLM